MKNWPKEDWFYNQKQWHVWRDQRWTSQWSSSFVLEKAFEKDPGPRNLASNVLTTELLRCSPKKHRHLSRWLILCQVTSSGLASPGTELWVEVCYEINKFVEDEISVLLICPLSSLFRNFTEFFPWQLGTKAPQAAGKIHTDFEKGFIMAEVYQYDDFKEAGSETAVKVNE